MKWAEISIMLGLILINGFFAGSELALVSARKVRLKALADRGNRGAQVALQLLGDPTRLLSAVQIGITFVGIFTGLYSGAAFADDFAEVLRGWPAVELYAEEIAIAVVVIVVTYFSLVLGELAPKRIALAHAESIAIFVARPMLWVAKIGTPLVWLLQISTEAISRLLPVTSAPMASVTEDEVRALIATGTKEGVFHNREREMIDGVLRLADRSVESIMIPRGDILWLDSNESLEALWSQARTSGHSRFLLCDGVFERLVGVITLADLGEALRLGQLIPQQHLRQPLHVPTGISVLRLMDLFRTSSIHLGLITGEYGEIFGLVTPTDVLRAIAGELPYDGNRERAEAVQRPDGSWLMDGQLSIHEVERQLGRNDLTEGDNFHTIAGFILWRLGRLPSAGESFTWRNLKVEILDMDGQRIDKVGIVFLQKADDAGDDGDGDGPST
jgi:putative hemolysin